MWTALKTFVVRFILKRIRSFLKKRALDIAEDRWLPLVQQHLSIIMLMKERVSKSGEIATLRVKHPRVYKRLMGDLEAMEQGARDTYTALLKGREVIR